MSSSNKTHPEAVNSCTIPPSKQQDVAARPRITISFGTSELARLGEHAGCGANPFDSPFTPEVARALQQIEEPLIRWLSSDAANAERFLANPTAVLQAAGCNPAHLELPFFQQLRALWNKHEAEQGQSGRGAQIAIDAPVLPPTHGYPAPAAGAHLSPLATARYRADDRPIHTKHKKGENHGI